MERARRPLDVRAACALAGVALFAGAGCQVYDPDLVEGERDAGCVSHQPPSRPTLADTSGDEVAFGLRQVVLEQGDAWAQYAYDVDGFCTGAPGFVGECIPPSGAARQAVDAPGGIDNVFGASFFPLVSLTTPELEESSRRTQERGLGLPIVRVRGWNGTPDDSRVDVAIMQAVFARPAEEAEESPPSPPEDPTTSPPRWDGRDWFWVRDDAFFMNDLEQPLIRDDNAYVVGGVLVARLPDRVDIVFPSDRYGVSVRVTGAIITAKLAEDGSEVTDVVVSGRWAISDLLMTAGNVGICRGERDYDLLVSQLDRIADVRSVPGSGGPMVECNAISLGIGFERGTRVQIAGTATGVPLIDRCALADGGVGDGGVGDGGMDDAGMDDAGVDDDDGGSPTNDGGADDASDAGASGLDAAVPEFPDAGLVTKARESGARR